MCRIHVTRRFLNSATRQNCALHLPNNEPAKMQKSMITTINKRPKPLNN